MFDCAAEHRGTSFNDRVFQGPDLTNKLIGVLLRFRLHPVAIMADIEATFHQVKVVRQDQDVLRFLWWPGGNLEEDPVKYRMTVHLFGGTWSPSCCMYALHKTAEDHAQESSSAAKDAVLRNFYVGRLPSRLPSLDDCLVDDCLVDDWQVSPYQRGGDPADQAAQEAHGPRGASTSPNGPLTARASWSTSPWKTSPKR